MLNKPFLAYWPIGRKLLSSRGPAAYRHRPLPKSLKIFSETTGWICFKSGMKLPCVNVCQEFSVFQVFFFLRFLMIFFPKKTTGRICFKIGMEFPCDNVYQDCSVFHKKIIIFLLIIKLYTVPEIHVLPDTSLVVIV